MPPIPRAQDQLFDRSRSAREKYVDLVVGAPGWGALVWHEFVTLLLAAGAGRARVTVLRKTLYPSLLGACGRNVIFGQRRRAAPPAQDPHRQQRRDRRQLPARRQGRHAIAALPSAAACSSAATPSCRARTATSTLRTAPTSASTASCFRPARCASAATRCSPPTAT